MGKGEYLVSKEEFRALIMNPEFDDNQIKELLIKEFGFDPENMHGKTKEEMIENVYAEYLKRMENYELDNKNLHNSKKKFFEDKQTGDRMITVKQFIEDFVKENKSNPPSISYIIEIVFNEFPNKYKLKGKKPTTRVKNTLASLVEEKKVKVIDQKVIWGS